MMAEHEQIDQLIKKLSERMGTSEGEIRSAVEKSSYAKLLTKLPADTARQMQDILSDEQKAKEFLSSPQAKAIIKKVMG